LTTTHKSLNFLPYTWALELIGHQFERLVLTHVPFVM